MNKLNLDEVTQYVEKNIDTFHKNGLKDLTS